MIAAPSALLADCLRPGKRAHLVGIGGVSMVPLALALRHRGLVVTGSDLLRSDATDALLAGGIPVGIGHLPARIDGADCVIRTAAAREDNPEIAAARAHGVPLFERAEAWGLLMREYRNAVCVAGTHGKTTVTAMLAQILIAAGRDPTVMLGGVLPCLGSGFRLGQGDTILLESCEYRNSFLYFSPTLALINNIDADHPDFFRDLAEIQASFRAFAEKVPAGGAVLANGDDPNTAQALAGLDYTRFGFGEANEVRGTGFSADGRQFDVLCRGIRYCRVRLSVWGRHNAADAIAACAAAEALGVEGEAAAQALAAFSGAKRRLEYKGLCRGAKVYDDYAHHPRELQALIGAVRQMAFRRVILAFQPHTYSRTKALLGDFAAALRMADQVVLAPIYAARERDEGLVSSRDLAGLIPSAVCLESFPEIAAYLRELARPGDVLVTAGAGDIYRVSDMLAENEAAPFGR